MGSTHNGGKPCTNAAHDPNKEGNKLALCGFSHVHWDATWSSCGDLVGPDKVDDKVVGPDKVATAVQIAASQT